MKDPQTASVEVDAHADHAKLNPVNPDTSLMIITWVSFFIVLAILQKFAWKPILDALEKREDAIRQSLDEAEKIKAELERIDQTRESIISQAEDKAKDIVEKSRQAANDAAKHIQQKAREENQIMLENAKREIQDELDNARSFIKQESIDVAVQLAEKLIDKNLDNTTNKRLINDFMKEGFS